MRQSKNYLTVDDNALAKLVVDRKSAANSNSKAQSTRNVSPRKKSKVTSNVTQKYGSVFTLR